MGFKMKGPSMYPLYKKASQGGIAVNRTGNPGAADGRASSSPFQKNTGDKTKEQLLKEGFTPADADRMIKDGATTGRQDNKKKTITKKKPVVKKKDKPVSQENFVPAYPGADYSKEQIAKMTEKEKIAKIDGYTPKKKTTTKKK